MAPEVAKELPYNKSVDAYSFGIMLHELLSAEKPFFGFSAGKHMSLVVLGGERPKMDHRHTSCWPMNLQWLMKRCWSPFPTSRPTFAVIRETLQAVLDDLGVEYSSLLRLSGEEHVPLSPPDGISITDRIVYKVGTVDMPDRLADQLAEGAVVLLHSAAAAAHFANECNRLGVMREAISLCALGPRILEPVGEGWQAARAAANPTEDDLLALAIGMCQD